MLFRRSAASATAATARVAAARARYPLTLLCFLAALGSAPFALFDVAKIIGLSRDQLQRPAWRTDFLNLYSGAYLITHAPADLYHLAAQSAVQQAVLGHAHPIVPFLLPPYAAVAIGWLGFVPYGTAYLLWLLVGGCSVVLAARLLARPGHAARDTLVWTTGLLLFLPVVEGIGQAQTSAVMLLSLAALTRGLSDHEPGQRTRWLWLAVVGCALKPQLSPCILLALALDRRIGTLGRAALAIAGLAAIGLALGGPDLITSYRQVSAAKLQESLLASPDFLPGPTVLHAAQRLLGAGLAASLVTVLVDSVLLASVAWAWRCGLAPGPSRPLQLALLPLIAVLAAPYALIHELSAWPVSLGLLLQYTRFRSAGRALVLLLGTAVWIAADLGVMEPNGTRGADLAALLGLLVVGYILVSLRHTSSGHSL